MPANPKIEMAPLASLRPYANNARRHSRSQIRQIAQSMHRFGFTNPVLVSGEGEIIAGHGQVMAAKELGLSKVPTIRLSHLSATERRAYIIADNKLALTAGWHTEILAIEFETLGELDFDLSLTGFSIAEINFTLEQARAARTDPRPGLDVIPPPPLSPVTRFSELWRLGRHKLLCGDARSPDDIARRIGNSAPIWTSPIRPTMYGSMAMSAGLAPCVIASSRWRQARCRGRDLRTQRPPA